MIVQLANRLSTSAQFYSVQRPAALWANPDAAGVALLVGFVLSFWGRGWLMWLGRAAAVIGILLSSSREALYPLLLFVVFYAVAKVVVATRHERKLLLGKLIGVVVGVAAALASAPAVSAAVGAQSVLTYALARFADFGQNVQSNTDPSRQSLWGIYFGRYLNGPWQGNGLFAFQGTTQVLGAHNMFVVVLGETGPLVFLLYCGVFLYALGQRMALKLLAQDRILVGLLWMIALFESFVSHNAFTDVTLILLFAIMLCLPNALGTRAKHQAKYAVQPSRMPPRAATSPLSPSR